METIKENNYVGVITREDYVLTNIDLATLYFTIRLKDEREYIVYYKKEKGKKQENYIKKEDGYYLLSDEVVKFHLAEVRRYRREGI